MSNPTTDSKMYQTMHRQPDDLRRVLSDDGWNQAGTAAGLLAAAGRIFVIGIGTSYHAALVGAWLVRAAGLDARAVSSFDFALYPESFPLRAEDAVVIMAHTGVKQYSAASLARASGAGATIISVGSLTAEHPGSRLVLRTVEREQSAAYTSSHLTAMTVLAQVATALGERTGNGRVSQWRDALAALPDQVAAVLARESEIEPVARLAVRGQVYAAAAGPNEATALELVIKAREAAYGRVDALAVEQFLHGPMVAVNAGDLAVLVNVAGAGASRVAEVAAVLAAIGARLWLVGDAAPGAPAATVFSLPSLPEDLSPLLTVVPMQILAYQMAVLNGTHPDTFRRDDPIYKDAFGLLKL
ncbi:MAG: SIS domain-containing protein [Chloroflexota bacterium]|nr:SIS domain-containing protein [Chloroflexota bacterium]